MPGCSGDVHHYMCRGSPRNRRVAPSTRHGAATITRAARSRPRYARASRRCRSRGSDRRGRCFRWNRLHSRARGLLRGAAGRCCGVGAIGGERLGRCAVESPHCGVARTRCCEVDALVSRVRTRWCVVVATGNAFSTPSRVGDTLVPCFTLFTSCCSLAVACFSLLVASELLFVSWVSVSASARPVAPAGEPHGVAAATGASAGAALSAASRPRAHSVAPVTSARNSGARTTRLRARPCGPSSRVMLTPTRAVRSLTSATCHVRLASGSSARARTPAPDAISPAAFTALRVDEACASRAIASAPVARA